MPQTLTFTKVFGPVTKEGAKWTRWDYKTGDDTRYVRFRSDQDIPLNTAVNVELEDNKIASWSLAAGNQQAGSESQNGSQAVRSDSAASQGHSGKDFAAEARGKSKFGFWQALLPVMFSSLPKAEQTVEAAAQLVDHAMGEVFPEDVPF